MINTVIIDDDPNNREKLHQLLIRHCPEVEVAGMAENMEQARKVILETTPDLVFLDTELPSGNAFEFIRSLLPVKFEVIFITDRSTYAIEAIKYSAIDYLLQPVKVHELKSAVFKAAELIRLKNISRQLEHIYHDLKADRFTLQKIALPTIDGLLFVDLRDLMWLEANGNYTHVHLHPDQKILVSRNLKDFEGVLPEHSFSRIHQSYIINHNFIKKYNRGRGGTIEMADGTTFEVSMRKKDEFLAKFK